MTNLTPEDAHRDDVTPNEDDFSEPAEGGSESNAASFGQEEPAEPAAADENVEPSTERYDSAPAPYEAAAAPYESAPAEYESAAESEQQAAEAEEPAAESEQPAAEAEEPAAESEQPAAEAEEPAAVPFAPKEDTGPVPLIEPDEPVTPYEPVAPLARPSYDQPLSDQQNATQSDSQPRTKLFPETSDPAVEPSFTPAYAPPTEAYPQPDQPGYGQPGDGQPGYGQVDHSQPPAYAAGQQPIYVQAPIAPTKKGNRGIGTLLALLGAVIFGLVYAGVAAVIILVTNNSAESFADVYTRFLSSWVFWAAIVGFAVVLILIVVIVNRANWWAYVLGGFLVGVGAYFATIGGAYLSANGWTMTQSEASEFFGRVALNPYTIAAGIAAREVSIWIGAWIAARARKVKLRNSEAQLEYERQLQAAPSFQQPR